MDADRFDRLTLSFADLRARRGILKSVAAGLAGIAGLSGLSLDSDFDAEAKRKKKKKKKKKKGKNKKKNNCTPTCLGKSCGASNGCGGKCNSGTCPNALETCRKGSCTCLTQCCVSSDCPVGGTCDPDGTCDCGNCCFDDDCPPGQICANINNQRQCFFPQ